MIFNGTDFSQWLRVNPTRKLMPPIDIITQDVPGRAGTQFVRKQLKPLTIPVTVKLQLPPMDYRSVAALRRQMAAKLITDGPAKLVLPDEPDLYYMSILSNPGELSNLWYTGSADLEFEADDPIAYGADKSRAVASGGSYALEIGGTAETSPVIALTANGNVVQAKNSTTGLLVKTVASITSGAKVVIDMAKQLVTVNGNMAPVVITSDYWTLAPGAQTVYVYGGTGTMSWTERWL